MHSIKLLYVDGNDVRRTIDIEAPDLIKPIGLQRYTDFENVANTGPEPNGTYPVLDDKTFNELYGKALTLVDASFAEATQRDAFKNVLKGILSEWFDKQVGYTFRMTEQQRKK